MAQQADPTLSFGHCSATADPTFSIPADLPLRDQVRLVFSPNLAPAAVSQPATGWLVMAGLGFSACAFLVGTGRMRDATRS